MLIVRAIVAAATAVEPAVALGCFIAGALAIARVTERAGLADRAADLLARASRGRMTRLYLLVCATCALLTMVVSLDGAVVLMAPLLLALRRRGANTGPLLMGTIAVANSFSFAVPQGNPTNILVSRTGGPEFSERMLPAALAATALCVVAIAVAERRVLRSVFTPGRLQRTGWSSRQLRAAAALAAAGIAATVAPHLGIAAWWGVAVAGALAAALDRRGIRGVHLPWLVLIQIAALLVVLEPLAPHLASLVPSAGVPLALAAGGAAAIANNLPVSAVAAALRLPAAAAYPALVGLGAGSLATPRGSVATRLALDLTGTEITTSAYVRRWLPIAVAATAAGALTLWI